MYLRPFAGFVSGLLIQKKRCFGSVTSSWGSCCRFEDSIVAAEAGQHFAGVGVEQITLNLCALRPVWQSV